MKRIAGLAFCIIVLSCLPAFAQDYSGAWEVQADISYVTAHSGTNHGSYAGRVFVSQTDFVPPMAIGVVGNLQLFFSDASGYPPVFPLSINFTMPDANTLPAYTVALPPPYDSLTLTVDGTVNGTSASGTIASTIVGDGPGPISGTWSATKVEGIPTLTEWGMGLMIVLLAMGGAYLIRK